MLIQINRALPQLLTLLMIIGVTTGCARLFPPSPPLPPAEPTPGALFSATHDQISLDEFARKASQVEYVLVGESHTNPCDHQFQKQALAALVQAGLSPGLGLEMVPWSKQEVLDAFHQGEISIDQLEERLDWQNIWGYAFDLYRPVLVEAQALNVPLVALNTPKDLQDRIRLKGLNGIPADERGLLPSSIILPGPEHKEQLEKAFVHHLQMMQGHELTDDFELSRFLKIQSLWDTQMAHVAAQWRKAAGRPMVILAGSGHVNYGHGIARRLALLDDDPRILSVTPWRGNDMIDPAMADLFFFCPETPQPRLGMIIAWEDDRAVVTSVLPGSRAESAGIMAGDVLLQANNEPVTALTTLHHAGKAAASDQTPLRLEVLRGDEVLAVDIFFTH